MLHHLLEENERDKIPFQLAPSPVSLLQNQHHQAGAQAAKNFRIDKIEKHKIITISRRMFNHILHT